MDISGIDITEERKLFIYESLYSGSQPKGSFFLLVALSTLIAAFGLVMNSTAVIIGAMLVAPLMTPILGLALSLVRGDPRLMALALRAEFAGVIVAVVAAGLLGLLVPYFEETPEMLGRTHPNLYDLMVAVFAGIAGAYALVDEKLSPVLPGVAISTAIVPPLANVGLSLSLGAYQGAWGSFLLFFINFLSILLVSSIVFFLAGMAEEIYTRKGVVLVRRFGVAVIGFVVVGFFLSLELSNMLEQRRLENDIRNTLGIELAAYAVSDLERLLHRDEGDRILVLADVNSPKEMTPLQIGKVQDRLMEATGKPVQLYIRTTITHDVSAEGSINQSAVESLDGFYSPLAPTAGRYDLQLAEQVVREFLDDKLGFHLIRIQSSPVRDHLVIVANIDGFWQFGQQDIAELELKIRERLKKTNIRFMVNQREAHLSDRFGGAAPALFGGVHFDTSQEKILDSMAEAGRNWLEQHRFWADAWTADILDDHYVVLLEVVGAEQFTQSDLAQLRETLASVAPLPVELYVRARLEAVLGPDAPVSYQDMLQTLRNRSQQANRDQLKAVIRELNY